MIKNLSVHSAAKENGLMTASQSLESTAVYSDLTRTESDAGLLVLL